MDIFTNLLSGFAVSLAPNHLFYCIAGILLGILVGVLPGLGAFNMIALLLPFSAHIGPTASLILFCGVYCGSKYSCSATSILMNLPGEPEAIVTCVDGYAMAQRGRAGAALIICAIASFVAGMIGLVGLTLFAAPLAQLVLYLGPVDYLILAIIGIIIFTKTAGGSPAKTVMMVLFGSMLGAIGVDNLSSISRYNFGIKELEHGIDLSLLALGLFGVGELLTIVSSYNLASKVKPVPVRAIYPTREEYQRSAAPILRGGLLGFLAGLLPGPSVIISTFASYALEKCISRRPAEFGKGAIEGVAGPEAANSSAVLGTMVPSFALGLPFCGTAAVLLSGLLLHGISPGPSFIAQYPEIFWSVVASMFLGNVILLIINYPLVLLFLQVPRIPFSYLAPIILALTMTGVYTLNRSSFDLLLLVGFGLLGFLTKRAGYSLSPLIIGFVMGPQFERRMIQTLYLYQNDPWGAFSHPLTVLFLSIGAILIFLTFYSNVMQKVRRNVSL